MRSTSSVTFGNVYIAEVTVGNKFASGEKHQLKITADDTRRRLDKCMEFACVFELVKEIVRRDLGISRAGLMLGLAELPERVGAFHGVGGNFIVMNRRLLDVVVRSAANRRQINAYVFYILLHEYLHALGFLSEKQVEETSAELCEKALGTDHPATQMAKHGIKTILKDVTPLQHLSDEEIGRPPGLEIVSDFDREITKWYV
jgi:hypothetical protein